MNQPCAYCRVAAIMQGTRLQLRGAGCQQARWGSGPGRGSRGIEADTLRVDDGLACPEEGVGGYDGRFLVVDFMAAVFFTRLALGLPLVAAAGAVVAEGGLGVVVALSSGGTATPRKV